MEQSDGTHSTRAPLAFLIGGGEMGRRTRAFDWSRTILGPVERWPQSLRSALSICLNSSFPIALYWGRDLVLLYNDDWSPIPGEKHPWALGRPAREAWSEIWDIIGPLFEQVVTTGEATRRRDQLLPMHRHGFTEECYFDYTFSPIRGEGGQVDGVFNAVLETTTRVIGERRLRTLRELAAWNTDRTGSAEDACRTAARTLSENPHDLPFALLYLLDDDSPRARLAASTWLGEDSPARPVMVDLDGPEALWPFRRVVETGKGIEVLDLADRFGPLPGGGWPESPRRAVVLPMTKPGQGRLAGFVVAGLSPRLPFNDDYKGFLDLLAGHVTAAVANARAHEEERRRAEALAELDRAKTAFFSNVSHEFRTPLTLLLGPVEDILARRDRVEPDDREALTLVHRNALRLQKLVNSLLDFSRIEAGRLRASYEPTDLASLTAELASTFRSACERAGLDLVVDCPPLPEPVCLDRDMWEKIVLNLVSNAFKFTLEGRIEVRLRREHGQARLTVRDTGTGIPAEEIPHLFERFHRVEGTAGRTQEGSGIGLAMVRELARLHGGEARAESVSGEGSVFTVAIPFGTAHLPSDRIGTPRMLDSIAPGAAPYVEEALRWLPGGLTTVSRPAGVGAEATDGTPPAANPTGDRPHVLLADDNADMREYVCRLLAGRYSVTSVADGQAALESARGRVPDLVLSDVMMPGLDGFGLLQGLRDDPRTRDVPVLLLSARAGEEARIEGLGAGADDYITKPFHARELLARVASQIELSRLRRQGEQERRRADERSRAILESITDAFFAVDGAWRFTYVNGHAERLMGREPGHLLGKSLWGEYPGLAGSEFERPYRQAMDERVAGSVTSYYPDHDCWYEVHIYPAPDGLSVYFRDVTDRVRAEERERRLLEEAATANAKFRTLFEQGPLFAGIMAVDGTVIEANRLSLEACGFTREDVVGRPFWECPWWSRSEALAERIRVASVWAAAGEATRAELPYFIADGSERIVDLILMPIEDEAGRVMFLAPTGTDITDRKRAEERAQFQAHLLDTVGQAVIVTDPQGRIAYWNRFAETLYGWPADEVIGRSILEIVVAKELANRAEEIMDCMRAGESWSGEFTVRRRDGTTFPAFVTDTPVFDERGSIKAIVGVSMDNTERKQAEAVLKEADRRKDEFLATLAHELRNPLAPIRNALHLMKRSGGDDEMEVERAMAERQVVHLARLIDDLMDVARINRGQIDLHKEVVDLAQIVRQAVETARAQIDDRRHRLTVSLPEASIRLEADPTRLEQILWNLLNNSAKYTEPGGQIRLSVERDGGEAVVRVRDTGIGIRPELLPTVFDMFVQVGDHKGHAQGGLGIGLSLVRTLVELHGGSISAHSEGPGKGSEFVVRLPILARAREDPALRQAGRGGASEGPPRRRILVVDDNLDAARSLAKLLARLYNQEVRLAEDGPEALVVAGEFRPEVVLLDIGLPGMDGNEVARRLRQRPEFATTLIVALTGWGQESDVERSRASGFDHHMVKPASPEAILDLIKTTK